MPVVQQGVICDYAAYLDLYGMSYSESGFYYEVGETEVSQGWILHISVIAHLADGLFRTILPLLAPCPFKIIRDKKNLQYLNAGYQGFNRIGKVICVYPTTEEDALLLVERLLPALKTFKGPTILTDFYLGAVLYTRYGSFKSENLNYSAGDPGAIILDGHGNSFQDQYFIPPRIPEGMVNPFVDYILPPKYARTQHILHNRYWIETPISIAVKGNVLLARMRKGASARKCILKQGRENMISDDAGHDMKDRIKWQFAVHQDLANEILIPQVYEYFEVEGDGFISMEYIGGTALNQLLFKVYGNSLWPYLPREVRKELLTYLDQILISVQKIHKKGYVHRDITSNNFIVTRKKKVYFIDFELAYSYRDNFPRPPFESATIGYASPQHLALKTPAIQDDIYSIGALLITFFTGLEPMFIIEQDQEHLREKLLFLIRNEEITDLVIRCLDPVPDDRPSLAVIFESVRSVEKDQDISMQPVLTRIEGTETGKQEQVIQRALNGLVENYPLSSTGVWVASSAGHEQLQTNAMIVQGFCPDIQKGVGGILYMLSQAKACGFNLVRLDGIIEKAWQYEEELQYTGEAEKLPGGLYFGRAGIAVMMAAMEENKLVEIPAPYLAFLREWFVQPEKELNLFYGIAGQGMGLLRCRGYIRNYREIADHYAAILILLQQKDGSWVTTGPGGKLAKNTGFAYGMAGIIYFLLEYYRVTGAEGARTAACQGLSYLEKKAIKTNGRFQWNNSDIDDTVGGWWGIGAPGIALAFLKAFQVIKVEKYKLFAEKALDFYPTVFKHFNLGQQQGLSGLGEVYLEAWDVLQDDKYRDKADWIAGLLNHLVMNGGNNSSLWCVENNYYPVPGLLTGNSGILHFLLRSRFPDKIGFPVIGAK